MPSIPTGPKLRVSESKYVYDGTEVKMTGRAAKKPSVLNANTTIYLYEITPADPESISWKKWVKMDDLYVIDNDSE